MYGNRASWRRLQASPVALLAGWWDYQAQSMTLSQWMAGGIIRNCARWKFEPHSLLNSLQKLTHLAVFISNNHVAAGTTSVRSRKNK
jgi:hypothetical protein